MTNYVTKAHPRWFPVITQVLPGISSWVGQQWTSCLRYWDLTRWTVSTMLEISPRLTQGLIAVSIISGLTPVALFLAIRGVIDSSARSEFSQSGAWFTGLTPWLILLFSAAALEAFASLARKLLRSLLLDEANRELTAAIMAQAARQPIAFFEQQKSQDTLERLQGQVATRLVELIHRISYVLTSSIQVMTLMAILIRIEPWIAAAAVPSFLPYLWFQIGLSGNAFSDHESRTGTRRRIGYYLGLLTRPSHAAEVRLLGLAPHFVNRFQSVMGEFNRQDARRHWLDFKGSLFFATLSLIAFFGVFSKVAYEAMDGRTSIGDVTVFATAVVRLRKSLEDMSQSISSGLEQARHVEALRNFLALPAVEESDTGTALSEPFRADIRCEHLSFRYPGASGFALEDLCLEISAGETVAIVGENGSGKSTLVKLLAGFYEPTEGRILISDRDIQEYSLPDLRRRISFVFQDFGRYAASVAENIAYGDWHRLKDNPLAAQDYASRASLDRSVKRMPEGYDTVLGKQFGAFEPSGGVWQKIAIARALAREAPLLILDEPTANVDPRAEYELFTQLANLAKGRTTLLISHRFSTVSMAQRILVMDRGRIVEQGTHADLLDLNGHYARLYGYYQRRMFDD